MTVYHITLGDGRTTKELVAAAKYGYCHSQVFSDNFPARPFNGDTPREIVLLTFDHPGSSEEALAEAPSSSTAEPPPLPASASAAVAACRAAGGGLTPLDAAARTRSRTPARRMHDDSRSSSVAPPARPPAGATAGH